jgi:ribonuclease D
VPHPIFDTQVAAMVCGFGESIGYYALVADICGVHLDKSAQFTDWSRRPLSKKQLVYALDDVTYLRDIYEEPGGESSKADRAAPHGSIQEMDILTSRETYENKPRRCMGADQGAHRQAESAGGICAKSPPGASARRKARDVPRQRIVKDEVLADMAIHPPETAEELGKIRGLSADFARGKMGKGLLEGRS